jgi:dUTPase
MNPNDSGDSDLNGLGASIEAYTAMHGIVDYISSSSGPGCPRYIEGPGVEPRPLSGDPQCRDSGSLTNEPKLSTSIDLRCSRDTLISWIGGNIVVPTGVFISPSRILYGWVSISNEIALSKHLAAATGTPYLDGRGQVTVVLFRTKPGEATLSEGELFAHLVFERLSPALARRIDSFT